MSVLNQGVLAITASIAAGATVDIQPPSGEEWFMTALGSGDLNGIFTGADVSLTDGTTTVLLRKGDPTTGVSLARTPTWLKPFRFGLTNTKYLRIKNLGGGALRFFYSGRITGVGIAGIGDVKTAISTSVAAGSYVTVQPSSGEYWVLHEVGIADAGWADSGGANRYYPKLSVRIYDGANEIKVSKGDDWSLYNPLRIVLSNTVYARIYNEDSVARDIGYIAQLIAA